VSGTSRRTSSIAGWSAVAFGASCIASYFLRSDGYGLPGAGDGIRRCGFPWVFRQQGGWSELDSFFLDRFALDLLFAVLVGWAVSVAMRRLRPGRPR
jgi:hypothetical protein